ncbi:type II toxin-antitoxin system HipA family toxin [Photorhabdus temperata]|uniref:HipA-like protein n=1 Tax=Photorhabdus temperata subsp. temperata Meg1 TaxID=1393735 RepID=A0A081S1I4_PHOTE|nr:type II toxin-antitoxin system HipA family toxin [Photorhabdus temperata]KER04787.1 HipA-like protein [Photorhabdus temperata subsp. temperata Meg1]MCT8346567.1 type II toxin-antitoxin system HipA family toxin [Photorhabdus temperata]
MTVRNFQYRSLSRLQVIYSGWGEQWVLGHLAESTVRGRYLFEYTHDALESGIEFSPLKLPLSTETYTNFEHFQDWLPGFISDSLPDGWGRLLMDRFLRRNHVDPGRISVLERLALLGDNTMGALTYQPVLPLPDDQEDKYSILSLTGLAQQIRQEVTGQDSEALQELFLLGGSPHGARPKAQVEYNPSTGQMRTTAFPGSEPWLVKFPAAEENPWVCALEEVYACMARMANIDFPASRYFRLEGELAAFGVRRFDRENGMRVPVLSMAGALHADFRLPCMDYTDILRATGFITRSVVEREIQAQRMVFNVLMYNRDDHVKNFAFILNENDEWVVSPAYDLTFADGPGGQHQTAVGGHGSDITRTMLLKVANNAGIAQDRMNNIINEVADVVADFAHTAQDVTDDIPTDELHQVTNCINRNLSYLKR